jgi:DNA (cytosine-5)-methyltransferase 1
MPSPIGHGVRGQPRLSSRFVEWLMGLPAGHVTGLGLPYSAELRALGNGVVPQQAEQTLSVLLKLISFG